MENEKERVQGACTWFDEKKGYGFIEDGKGNKFFVHFTAIQESGFRRLDENQLLSFIPKKGDKGMMATNVIPE